VKASGVSFCENCKNLGQDEKNCTNKKAISFDPRYVLFKNSKSCISAKFVWIPINGAKKMSFGCLRLWSLTFKDPRMFGYLNKDDFLL